LLLVPGGGLSRPVGFGHNGHYEATLPAREAIVEEFLKTWGYLGVFVGIIATGLGFPMPEEVPVVIGGGLVHDTNGFDYRWWLMLLVCIVGVIVGDSCLYLIGRWWGVKLLDLPLVRKRLLRPERLVSISHNFKEYGVKILLFARLTPGIRAPIFVTAGILKLPWPQFLLADGIYAIPGVSLLFFLGYWFTDSIVDLIKAGESQVRSIVIIVALLGVVAYFIYRHLRKPVVEGSPAEMPPVVGPVTTRLEHTLETVKDKILHPSSVEIKCGPCQPEIKCDPCEPPAKAENGQAESSTGAAPQPQGEKSQPT
jgi:membrane protein DedA with SNARE-associated domain